MLISKEKGMDWVPAPITTGFSTRLMVICVLLTLLARVRNLPNPAQATNIKKTMVTIVTMLSPLAMTSFTMKLIFKL